MKKRALNILLLTSIILLLLISFVSALFDTYNINNAPAKSEVDQKVIDAYQKSPILRGASYFIFGLKDLSNEKTLGEYGAATIVVIFFLIWLILFVTFSDILASFGAFSNVAIGWIVGGAITIIAANIGIIQSIALFFIEFTAIFGTFAVFFGIIMAFIAFVGISWGGGKFAAWALTRKANILAHRGRTEMAQGIRGLREAGAQLQGEADQASKWWIPVLVVAIIIALISALIALLA